MKPNHNQESRNNPCDSLKRNRILFFTLSIIIVFLIAVYSISMTLIKNEDFIGSYFSVKIKPDITMEICGTSTGIINQKNDETIISDIDSISVMDDMVYGICKKNYFLLSLSNKNVKYSSNPIPQYSTQKLLSPMEYYSKKTMYINNIGLIVLIGCIFLVIKVGLKYRNKF